MSGIEGPGVISGGGGAADWNTLLNRPPPLIDIGGGQPALVILANGSQAQGLLFTQGTLEMAAGTDSILGANTISLTSVVQQNLGAPGSVNNQALPVAALVWQIGTDNGSNTFTGIEAPTQADRVIFLYNAGGLGSLTLTHQDVASVAANRIICPNALPLILRPGSGVELKYDTAASRWRVFGNSQAEANIQEFTVSGTWTKPVGAQRVHVVMFAGCGGGGGGARVASGNACSGGAGGGGGSRVDCVIPGALLGNVTVTIGTGGAGGAGATVDGVAGGNGEIGLASTFGSHLTAYPGGGGAGGQLNTTSGGGGGGGLRSTGVSATGATGGATGLFGSAGGSGIASASTTSPNAGSGGAGGPNGALGVNAGATGYGCNGGASGGGISVTPTAFAGGAGLSTFFAAQLGGGAATGANGQSAAAPLGNYGGQSPSGGGGNAAGAGGNGGTGNRSGGAGGGSAIGGNGGAGGDGGGGYCIVVTTF